MRKNCFLIMLLIMAVLAGLAAASFCQERSPGRSLLLGPLVCLPPDSFEVNHLLPAPSVSELDPYTGHLGSIEIDWEPEINGEIAHYWVVSSDSEDFDTVLTCSLWDSGISSCSVHLSVEDTVYCRVYSVDEQGRISPSAETVSTVADTTAPEIISLAVNGSAGGGVWVSRPEIEIDYQGWDNANSSGCDLIRLAERDSSFSGVVRDYPSGSFSGSVSYRLSAGYERKVLYTCLVDRAGNRSTPLRTEIMYEQGAHCYPNPFNPERGEKANIVYRLNGPRRVTVYLYDRFGNLVLKKSDNGGRGWNEISWDGRNGRGRIVSNGGYICVIEGERDYKCKVAVLK
ncbi:MAG: hypothetical protein GF417_10185 [Candidatus Latescibacteria bacterium]|nr:hypothetical protein [bacterium]MBD3424795.1 hypothetical protein [Candidatus Latescibacterota bacterium]